MTTTQGKIHKYLRMTIDYSSQGKVIFPMVYYIINMLNYIQEDMKGESKTPSTHHFFDITEDATKLSQTNSDRFHYRRRNNSIPTYQATKAKNDCAGQSYLT